MIETQAVTLDMPVTLKARLEQFAKQQGISLNNLANELLVTRLNELEFFIQQEQRLAQTDIKQLKQRVNTILDKVPANDVPNWDKI